jgi:hypothetical protein
MIHMYGVHRMRKRNFVRYPFHVLDSDSFAEPVCSGISVLFLKKGVIYALDNICYPADLVVPGDGQLLHIGWLYPHLAVNRCGCPDNKLNNRTARCNLR